MSSISYYADLDKIDDITNKWEFHASYYTFLLHITHRVHMEYSLGFTYYTYRLRITWYIYIFVLHNDILHMHFALSLTHAPRFKYHTYTWYHTLHTHSILVSYHTTFHSYTHTLHHIFHTHSILLSNHTFHSTHTAHICC